MKVISLVLFIFHLIQGSMEEEHKIACYFLVEHGPVTAIDQNICTHVLAYGILRMDAKSLQMVFHNLEQNKRILSQLKGLKSRNPKLRIVGVLDCGGNDCLLPKIVVNPQLRTNFVKNAIKMINEFGFDGLDLDWEYPAHRDHKYDPAYQPEKKGFSDLLKELRNGLSSHQSLSAAVHPLEWLSKNAYDFESLSSTLDFVNVMDYDAAGGWDHQTGHHSNFDWTLRSMNYWASKVPKNKLLMGIPFYGVKFELKDPTQHGLKAPIVGDISTQIIFAQICKSIKTEGWKQENTAVGPIAYKGNQWVCFDDPTSVAKKAKWVRDNGFGGVMIWETNQDDINGECSTTNRPMMRAVYSGLFGRS